MFSVNSSVILNAGDAILFTLMLPSNQKFDSSSEEKFTTILIGNCFLYENKYFEPPETHFSTATTCMFLQEELDVTLELKPWEIPNL